jgi:2'-5' RNA ligase
VIHFFQVQSEEKTMSSGQLPSPPLNLLSLIDSTWHSSSSKRKKRAKPDVDKDESMRLFAHVDGNFAVHIYVQVHVDENENETQDWPSSVWHRCSSSQIENGGDEGKYGTAQTDVYHVSLSHTFALRRHQLDSLIAFVRCFTNTMRSFTVSAKRQDCNASQSLSSSPSSLSDCCCCYRLMKSRNGSREFVSLLLDDDSAERLATLHNVVSSMLSKKFGVHWPHDKFAPHVSVLWHRCSQANDENDKEIVGVQRRFTIKRQRVSALHVRVGQRVSRIDLAD